MPAATAASLAACRRACSVEGEAPAGVAHATDASNSSATTYARVDQRVATASVEVSICRLPLWRGPSESLLLHLVRRNALEDGLASAFVHACALVGDERPFAFTPPRAKARSPNTASYRSHASKSSQPVVSVEGVDRHRLA